MYVYPLCMIFISQTDLLLEKQQTGRLITLIGEIYNIHCIPKVKNSYKVNAFWQIF